jgi:hypothetical protein
LKNADLLDPSGTQQALVELGILRARDIVRLDAAEATEMVSSLRMAGVTLGDRSRLRELADLHRAKFYARRPLHGPRANGSASSNSGVGRALQEAKADSLSK